MATVAQLGTELRDLRETQAKFFTDHKAEDGTPALSAEQVAEARKRNDDITAKAKEYETAQDVETMASGNDAELKRMSRTKRITSPIIDQADIEGKAPASSKTLGELFVESDAFKAWKPGMKSSDVFEIDLEAQYGKGVAARGIKAVFDSVTTTGWAPQAMRLPDAIIPGSEVVSVASLMPQGRTSSNAVPYMLETTSTSGAAEVAESGAKGESALGLTEQTSAVRKIATWLPVTDEALEDVPMVESYIDTRLRTFVQLRENLQLLRGDGAPPNLRGILNTANVQTQAKGADPTPDAVYKAMTKIRVNSFFEPTAGVFHPNDWQDVRLLRTVDGIYIWGSPADAGPERIWGINVLQTSQMLENTGLVGSFRAGAQIFRRSDIALSVGWINEQFTHNQRTILLEERLALVVFRPAAFCTITGI
jgi:hypothetical protein